MPHPPGATPLPGPRRTVLNHSRRSARPARYLIVNADDFGADEQVNRGIIEAHARGIVTSASLMVDMPGARAAVRLAGRYPGLSVGLHVDFTSEGRTIDLSDRRLLQRELARQLDAFGELTGGRPTHLDSHHHMHRGSSAARLFLEVSRDHGIPLRDSSRVRYVGDFYGQWADGRTDLSLIGIDSLVALLQKLRPGFTELACHPGAAGCRFDAVYSWQRELEVRALTDPRAKAVVARAGIRLISYREYPTLVEPTTTPRSTGPVISGAGLTCPARSGTIAARSRRYALDALGAVARFGRHGGARHAAPARVPAVRASRRRADAADRPRAHRPVVERPPSHP
ncbi:MAG TPA: ChbG/HpnK family deacetylase [Methylomirabilota bacterium]|nr:ChbG/HpnK family deacetylase [Methylomirabilota bacterium]